MAKEKVARVRGRLTRGPGEVCTNKMIRGEEPPSALMAITNGQAWASLLHQPGPDFRPWLVYTRL